MARTDSMTAASLSSNKKIIAMDYVVLLLEYLRQKHPNIHDDTILKNTGIDHTTIANRDGFLSISQYSALLDNAQQYLQDPVLGLRLGQLQHIAAHGPLGYAILSSKSLDEALNMVCRFIRIRNNLTQIHYERSDNKVVLRMGIETLPIGPLYQFVVEQSFSSFVYIVKSLSGINDMPLETRFCYPEPNNSEFYQTLFGAPPVFSASSNELCIARDYLTEFKLNGDDMFASLAEQQCQKIMTRLQREDGIVSDICQILMSNTGSFPKQGDVAAAMNMSVRTLVRRLAEQQTSFAEILNDCKFELAKNYLLTTDWSNEEIAYLLGYESPGNFSRSFKKWAALSPSVFRRTHR
ncbi:putative HTH-type transcriptional regulator [BD1-7 clade bacterium]|uniref:Putative HTH-type transcriptional regulator n=1 Tax=BD1-7 clade bacterium TaxID=2029982 RepID=A0A5S9QRB7_9GAMM|nr:putative HTH-type transcriptional regulator [BD1-7 clade bacterium]